MRKTLFALFSILFILGCSTSKKVAEIENCPTIYKNNYTEILHEKYKTIYKNDTITFNEVRYECVYSAFYTHKVMFDRFGKWDDAVFPANRSHPILMWKNVDLFSNGKKYTVYTNGIEGCEHIYASVMVFDEKEIDLLAEGSPEKEKLTEYFANLIKNHNIEKKDFYDLYWKMWDKEYQLKK